MAKRIYNSTPRQDGFRMPGEFEPQERIWMIWPQRPDTWRDNAKPARQEYAQVAKAIVEFTPVTMLVSSGQRENAGRLLTNPGGSEQDSKMPKHEIRILEMDSDDAWARDTGPSFLVNDKGVLRACDWTFNAWGGSVDGLFAPWDKDDLIAGKICELTNTDSYRTDGFVLEGGSFHVDGQGTVLTTEMCLLSGGRNPHMTKEEIEEKLKQYLNAEKVIWLKDGIDPEETNGHVDDVACFVRPGEVACIYEENPDSPFYKASHAAYEILCGAVDARGRRLKVHKLCCTKRPIRLPEDYRIADSGMATDRKAGDICIASYANFLITNGGVIVPQYGDENDALALRQIQALFPERRAVGVYTREIVYGGGNIHCITQQQPLSCSVDKR